MVAAEGDSDELGINLMDQSEGILRQSRRAKSESTTHTESTLFAGAEGSASGTSLVPMLETHEESSSTSAVSSSKYYGSTSDKELHFPPMPGMAQTGSPFSCPYCLASLQLEGEYSEHQWK